VSLALIPYVGAEREVRPSRPDDADLSFGELTARQWAWVLRRWREGCDTAEIARQAVLPEAVIAEWLSEAFD
jgi:hypothetical protein